MTIRLSARGFLRLIWRLTLNAISLPALLRFIRSGSASTDTIAGRVPSDGSHSCLANSILNVHQLEKNGVTNRLAIGVKKENGNLLAHAWVEKDGEDFDEQEGFKKLGTL